MEDAIGEVRVESKMPISIPGHQSSARVPAIPSALASTIPVHLRCIRCCFAPPHPRTPAPA